jgi:hypothetical protein
MVPLSTMTVFPARRMRAAGGSEVFIMARRRKRKPEVGKDFIWEDGRFVFTREYLLTLGDCCENDCPNCPYHRSTLDLNSNGNGMHAPAAPVSAADAR